MMVEHLEYDVIVLGNGFDVTLGLPTKYSNFYKAIRAYDNSNDFDSFFKGVFESFDGLRFDTDLLLKLYDLLNKYRNNNYFLLHLMNQVVIYDNWCDVESEIKNVLLDFDYSLGFLKQQSYTNSNIYEFPLDGIGRYVMFDSKNVPEWRSFIFKTVDDYNNGMIIDKAYQGPYDRNSLSVRCERIKNTISKFLYEDLMHLKDCLKIYLLLASSVDSLKIKWNFSCTSLVTYNYTNTATKILTEETPFHIHGDLDNEIVLGINNETNFKNDRFESFTKSNQRTSVKADFSLSELTKGMINYAYYGLSFDSNDKNTLFYLLTGENSYHTVFFYKEKEEIVRNIQKLLGKKMFDDMQNDGRLIFVDSRKAYEVMKK